LFNGMAVSNNGAVFRTWIGYGYIAPEHAGRAALAIRRRANEALG
jgi:hypothetical protein